MSDELTKPTVMILVPTRAYVHHLVVNRLLQFVKDARYHVSTCIHPGDPLDDNMNKATKLFLASGHDWLLRIDSDNPPLANVLDVIALNMPIIGFPTPCVTGIVTNKKVPWHWYWNVIAGQDDKQCVAPPDAGTGLQQVKYMGSGCMLIRRDVLQAVSARHNGEIWTRGYIRGQMTLADDWAFCDRARAEGYAIHTHWDYRCRHIKEVDLYELVLSDGFGAKT